MTPTVPLLIPIFIAAASFFAMLIAHFAYTRRFALMWSCSAVWFGNLLIAVSTLQRLQ